MMQDGLALPCLRAYISIIARFEQSDAAVHRASKPLPLRRESPPAVGFVAIRSCGAFCASLLASPKQTEEAVRGSLVTVARSASVSAGAEQLRGVSAARSDKSSAFTRVH